MTKEKSDDFVEDVFAEFSGDIRMGDVFEWQPELALQEETYSTTLQGRRQLIQQQDEEYRLAVEADQRKEKERESAREKEVLREERKTKVPDEPQIEEEHVVVCVRHLNLGVVTRVFPVPPTPVPPTISVPPTPTASLVLPAPTAPLTLPTLTAPLAPVTTFSIDNYRTETLDGEENTSFEVM